MTDKQRGSIAAQVERERLAAEEQREASHGAVGISRFFDYPHYIRLNDDLHAITCIVRQMRAAGYLAGHHQIKASLGGTGVLRISDYHTRASADPALNQGFWFEGDVICAGDEDEYKARHATLS